MVVECASPRGTPLPLHVAVDAPIAGEIHVDWEVNGVPAQSDHLSQDTVPRAVGVGLRRLFMPGEYDVSVSVFDTRDGEWEFASTVRIVDTTPPTLICPPDVTLLAGTNGLAKAPSVLEGVAVEDNATSEADIRLAQIPRPATWLAPGAHDIRIVATDEARLSSTNVVRVRVVDVTPPRLDCPPAVRLTAPLVAGRGRVPRVLEATSALDNCTPEAGIVLTQEPAPGTFLEAGEHTVHVTAMDAAGNTARVAVALTIQRGELVPAADAGIPLRSP
jgi:hypothetical protein